MTAPPGMQPGESGWRRLVKKNAGSGLIIFPDPRILILPLWVNGQEIPPPKWKRGGQKGNSEIPLTDEGYEYRVPSKVWFKKGWNTVLLKAPVGSFKGEWQNPVKWMFTFVCFDE